MGILTKLTEFDITNLGIGTNQKIQRNTENVVRLNSRYYISYGTRDIDTRFKKIFVHELDDTTFNVLSTRVLSNTLIGNPPNELSVEFGLNRLFVLGGELYILYFSTSNTRWRVGTFPTTPSLGALSTVDELPILPDFAPVYLTFAEVIDGLFYFVLHDKQANSNTLYTFNGTAISTLATIPGGAINTIYKNGSDMWLGGSIYIYFSDVWTPKEEGENGLRFATNSIYGYSTNSGSTWTTFTNGTLFPKNSDDDDTQLFTVFTSKKYDDAISTGLIRHAGKTATFGGLVVQDRLDGSFPIYSDRVLIDDDKVYLMSQRRDEGVNQFNDLKRVYLLDQATNLLPANGTFQFLDDEEYSLFIDNISAEGRYLIPGSNKPSNTFILYEFTLDCDLIVSSIDKTDETQQGASDGTITVNATSSGNITYQLDAGTPQTSNVFTGLAPATYTITVEDDNPACDPIVQMVTIEQGDIFDFSPFLNMSKAQSFQFSPITNTNDCTQLETFDNQLLENQRHFDFRGLRYAQKFNRCDIVKGQFQTDGSNNKVEIFDYCSDELVSSVTPFKTVQLTAVSDEFDVRIQDNGNQTSRVYFIGESSIPILLEVQDEIEIFNNADGYDGTHAIVGIGVDAVLGQQYLIIPIEYTLVALSSNGELRAVKDALSFDIWEFVVNFSSIVEGKYYIKVTSLANGNGADGVWRSEPIDLKESHPKTNLLEFTNIDNAYDINYQNNITHRIRVESTLFKRIPNADRENLRDTRGRLGLLVSKPQRKFEFEFWNLPPYLHELLALALDHDVVKVNTVQVRSEDGLNEPEYRERYGLANSTAVIEQIEWFETFNSNELGVTVTVPPVLQGGPFDETFDDTFE